MDAEREHRRCSGWCTPHASTQREAYCPTPGPDTGFSLARALWPQKYKTNRRRIWYAWRFSVQPCGHLQ